uniref:MarR family winged helix-turn-helix transcriptional regulator n=1 Tax=Castellaniella defragrans TaxID=75697 RepID=UPI003340F363
MGKNKPYLRQLLLMRSDWMECRLYANAERHGYGNATPAMSRLFALLGRKPVGLSELARRLTISRQAVHKLAQSAVQLGYIEFVDSDSDARVKLVRFTQKGWDMVASAERELDAIEEALSAQIGADRLQQLKDLLAMPWVSTEADEAMPKTR